MKVLAQAGSDPLDGLAGALIAIETAVMRMVQMASGRSDVRVYEVNKKKKKKNDSNPPSNDKRCRKRTDPI